MGDVYELTIGEMSAKFGVSLRALRFYESVGLLSPTRVRFSRYYTAKDQHRLKLILTGKRLGFSLSEISKMISSADHGAPPALPLNKDQIEAQIASLTKRRDEIKASLEELRDSLSDEKPEAI